MDELVRAGANISSLLVSKELRVAPIHCAMVHCSTFTAKMILEMGADPNVEGYAWWNPEKKPSKIEQAAADVFGDCARVHARRALCEQPGAWRHVLAVFRSSNRFTARQCQHGGPQCLLGATERTIRRIGVANTPRPMFQRFAVAAAG